MRLKHEPQLPGDVASKQVRERIEAAMRQWKRGWAERVLNFLSFIVAFITVLVFLALAAQAQETGQPRGAQAARVNPGFADSCRPPPIPADSPSVVLVSVGGPEAWKPTALREIIESYLGIRVVSVPLADFSPATLKGAQSLVFYGDESIQDEAQAQRVIEAAQTADIDVTWIGRGVSTAAEPLKIDLDDSGVEFEIAPEGGKMVYNATVISVGDTLMGEAVTRSLNEPMDVLAWYQGPEGTNRPAISSRSNFLHIGFDPLGGWAATYVMVVAMDALADTLKDRQPDPRIIFRLEDISSHDYGEHDTSITEVGKYLLSRGVFLHLSVIPESVNADGQVVSNIGDLPSVRELLENYPDQTELVQHGYRHYRDDPRNLGETSGEAFEFFFDDDETLGEVAVTQMTQELLSAGRALIEAHLEPVRIFEAPHWEMSPAGEVVVEDMFTMVHHPPLNLGGRENQVSTAWFTIRNDTTYAPSSAGYVALNDPDAVEPILEHLRKVSSLIPDPIMVIFFHPFMWNVPEGRDNLRVLIDRVEELGYRFISSCDEVSRIR